MTRPPCSLRAATLLVSMRSALRASALAALLAAPPLARSADGPTLDGAEWIWSAASAARDETAHFRKTFELAGEVKAAVLIGSCDNQMEVWVNGERAMTGSEWQEPGRAAVTQLLRRGTNALAVRARNEDGAAGLIVKLEVTPASGDKVVVSTDASWQISSRASRGWQRPRFDASGWTTAHVIGAYGIQPWGQLATPRAASATGGDGLEVLDGFKAELLYTVPKADQGSWVSLTVDDRGRLIASDQDGALYRITPPPIGGDPESTQVERLAVEIGAAHGLLHAFNSLYVVINGQSNGRRSGLYRVRDTDGDDQYDEITELKRLAGAGEHGPHAVLVAPDGKSLLVVSGNHTDVPGDIDASRVPRNWDEDLLLPRQWDARGHARGRLAPGGWVAKTDPAGTQWEVIGVGYRNEYDVAVNAHGELFTFDADMEWDMGTPWYRPTRVCHVTSGSDYGWRSGTGKWAEYYVDSLPATIDIGPGSPTGVGFGHGAKFPAKYQHALYILDWTFGTMYAVHLEPNGASYTATKEEFVSGRPLPLTDVEIGHDGAMYFTTGGRRTQSGLYRVTYVGSEPTDPAPAPDTTEAKKARTLRRSLEALHSPTTDARAAIVASWPHLGSDDRFLAYAARIALEHQDSKLWAERALAENDAATAIVALVALARQGDPALQPRVLAALDRIDYDALTHQQKLSLLRAYALTFIRMGKPSPEVARGIAVRLDAHYPAGDDMLNRELCRVLVYLDSPSVVAKTLELMSNSEPEGAPDIQALLERNRGYGNAIMDMLRNRPARQQIHYALALRNVRYGWTIEQRRQYFSWFPEAAKAKGGASYEGFLRNIQKEALDNASEAERAALADITGERIEAATQPAELPQPHGPGREWTMDALLPLVEGGLRGRDFERGQRSFLAARCGTCHRFDGAGGAVGPDLTSLVSRFSYRDLLETLFEPSKVISDQYESTLVTKKDGTFVLGRVVSQTDDELFVSADPYAPETLTTVKKSDVATTAPSPVSLMPEGLINPLNKEEVLDLIAFLMSRGDRNDRVFK